jgi:hypothetical protein
MLWGWSSFPLYTHVDTITAYQARLASEARRYAISLLIVCHTCIGSCVILERGRQVDH